VVHLLKQIYVIYIYQRKTRKKLSSHRKKIAKTTEAYGNHGKNPTHKIKRRHRKHKKVVAGAPVPPSFPASSSSSAPAAHALLESASQLPPGVLGDGHNEMIIDTIQQVMDLDNPSKNYKGHVARSGKLCPGCEVIKYNHDSPLSANDHKLLVKTHMDFPIGKDVKLHSQETLDRASLMVDEAAHAKKVLLDKYPVYEKEDSLIQLDGHY